MRAATADRLRAAGKPRGNRLQGPHRTVENVCLALVVADVLHFADEAVLDGVVQHPVAVALGTLGFAPTAMYVDGVHVLAREIADLRLEVALPKHVEVRHNFIAPDLRPG